MTEHDRFVDELDGMIPTMAVVFLVLGTFAAVGAIVSAGTIIFALLRVLGIV